MKVEILFENSGDAPIEELAWRAEPGSNGLATFSPNLPWLLVCQHGSRRISLMNVETGVRLPAVEYSANGLRFNGPNDVTVREEDDGIYLYFTDPVYAWLEKDRFEDLPYLDNQVKQNGPGYCGIYRARLGFNFTDTGIIDEEGREDKQVGATVELIAKMDRPNGIDFLKGSNSKNILVVSDCCQADHNKRCLQGTSRWNLYRPSASSISPATDATTTNDESGSGWDLISVIEDDISRTSIGCADGFLPMVGPHGQDILIASCAAGLCLVDVEKGEVVARMWTSAPERQGIFRACKVSNVARSPDRIFLTGNCGILQLPLRDDLLANEHGKGGEL